MRFHEFISQNLDRIIEQWVVFARRIQPDSGDMDITELRDHAREILTIIAADMATAQTDSERLEKSQGDKPKLRGISAAETHAEGRVKSGFSINDMVAEYRALRSSVLDVWVEEKKAYDAADLADIIRFNEGMDQAISESIAQYSTMVEQSQGILFGIIGHDLRSPLQTLSLGAQFLMQNKDVGSRLGLLGSRMFRSAQRMREMLDNLLDFTQHRLGGGIRISAVKSDLQEISNPIIEEYRESNPTRIIRSHVSGDCTGEWDAGRIGQVYQNLIGNALQHSPDASEVTICTEATANDVMFSVHNEGSPIPETEQQRIFDLLHRIPHEGDSNPHRNIGLGLYIVREIISAHKGTIEVTSTESDGTTFTVRLPKEQPS